MPPGNDTEENAPLLHWFFMTHNLNTGTGKHQTACFKLPRQWKARRDVTLPKVGEQWGTVAKCSVPNQTGSQKEKKRQMLGRKEIPAIFG